MRPLLAALILLACGSAALGQERRALADVGRGGAGGLVAADALRLYSEAIALLDVPTSARPEGWSDARVWELAEELARIAGLPEHEAQALLERARLAIADGALNDARALLDDGCERLADTAAVMGPWLFLERGALARREYELARAIALLDDAQDRARPDDRLFLASVEGERGRVCLKLGLLERAGLHLEREAEAARAVDDPAVQQSLALHRVRHAEACERYDEVVREVDRMLGGDLAFPRTSRAELGLMRARARLEAARRAGGEQKLRGALVELEAALRDPALPPFLGFLPLVAVAAAEARLMRFDEARAALARARALLENLAGERGTKLVAQERATLDAAEARVVLARIEAGDLDPGRAADAARLAACRADLEASFGDFLDVWRSAPALPGGIGFLQYGNRANVVADLIALLVACDPGPGGVRAAFDAIVEAQALGSLGSELGAHAPSLEETRAKLLGPRRGLLLYSFGYEASHVIVVGEETLGHAALARGGELVELRRTLATELALAPSGASDGSAYAAALRRARAAAHELAAGLLPTSVRAALAGWDEVYLCGLDDLGPLAVACLPDVDGLPLGRTIGLGFLPSVPVGVALADRPRDARERIQDLVLLASPPPSAAVQALWPAVAAAALTDERRAAFVAPFARVRAAVGDQATHAFLAEHAPGARVLHVFTHGVYDARRTEPAGLVLAPADGDAEGLFVCRDARALSAPPLVMLSACGAGRASVRRGEDGNGTFAGAWLAAGAQAVLLSPDDLDAVATAELTARFGREIAEGASPAAALRIAETALLDDPRFAHPSFWASLRVVGLAFEPVFRRD